MADITIVNWVYKPTYNSCAPSCICWVYALLITSESKSCRYIFLGVWTSINPSYFDGKTRATGLSKPIPIYTSWMMFCTTPQKTAGFHGMVLVNPPILLIGHQKWDLVGIYPTKQLGGLSHNIVKLYVTHIQLGIQTNTDCHLFLETTDFNFDAVGWHGMTWDDYYTIYKSRMLDLSVFNSDSGLTNDSPAWRRSGACYTREWSKLCCSAVAWDFHLFKDENEWSHLAKFRGCQGNR